MEITQIQEHYRLILASASPRRKELLKQIGLSFEIMTSTCEEHITQTQPEQVVLQLSAQKAEDVRARMKGTESGKEALVIGADTVVAFDGRILGKPKDREDAKRMLRMLQDRRHQVYTGVTLCVRDKQVSFYERTDVDVYPMTEAEIEEYIATGEPMDKAGAYGIQGRFAAYVRGIAGEYQNVVGLPTARLIHEIEKLFNVAGPDQEVGEMDPKVAQKIRLVATDIDGTLVKDSSPEVDPEIPKVFRELCKRGVLCCVASGRQYYSIRAMFADVADEIIYIAENGAHIVYRGRDLSVTDMDQQEAVEIIEKLRTYGEGYDFVVSTPEGSLIESQSEDFISLIRDSYHNKMRVVPDVLAEQPRIIKTAMRHAGSIRDIAEQELIPVWKDRVKVCMAGEEWVDFMDASVDKGNAIRFLQDYFKVTPEETMTFGDNENDIGLMRAAGESYAVANAREPVKQSAKHICPDYTQKGVLRVLQRLLSKLT